MKPRVVVLSGSLTGTVQALADDRLTIGRETANDLVLKDVLVSRGHCTIQKIDEKYELTDHDSRNGTFVNGVPIKCRTLEHGDTIRVGHSELAFLLEEEDTSSSLPFPSDDSTRFDSKTMRVGAAPATLSAGDEFGRIARDLTALVRISDISNSIRDIGLLQQEILRLIFEVVPAERGAVVLFTNSEEDSASVSSVTRRPGDDWPVSIDRNLVHRAIWERSIIATTALSTSGETLHVICAPLTSVEKTLGAIYLASPANGSGFGEDHVHFLGSISRIAAVALENRLVLQAINSENRELREQIHTSILIGESRQVERVREFIARVARSDSTVLIRGESGTGKELVARAIHYQSTRADRPFIAINCAAIPESLLESELFGHEKGAFTGAVATRRGKVESAEDGTLLLDEIGEMAPLLQAKLLRVLQQREFERVGGSRSLKFAARVLAATNRNLEQAIRSGAFRQDLFYRLNVVSVTVPPLREHKDDIPLLAVYFARKYADRSKRPFRGISRPARSLLMNYSWPGNIRELENAIEHAIVLGLTEDILPEDLPTAILEEQTGALEGARYHATVNKAKRDLILTALQEANGRYPEAAKALGIHPKYLHRLAKHLKIKSAPEDDADAE